MLSFLPYCSLLFIVSCFIICSTIIIQNILFFLYIFLFIDYFLILLYLKIFCWVLMVRYVCELKCFVLIIQISYIILVIFGFKTRLWIPRLFLFEWNFDLEILSSTRLWYLFTFCHIIYIFHLALKNWQKITNYICFIIT